MRIGSRRFYKPSLCLFLLSASFSSYASLVPKLSEYLKEKQDIILSIHDFELIEEEDIFFKEKPEILSDLHVQFSIKLLEPQEYKEKYRIYEIDGLSDHIRDVDRILFSKSVAVLKGVQADHFNASLIASPDYVYYSMGDAKKSLIDPEKYIFEQEKDLRIATVKALVHCSSFNLKTQHGQMMDVFMAEHLMKTFPIHKNPIVVTSMKSGPQDISFGSHGGRTVNFYYEVNGEDTLLISYELYTIKREARMFGPIWDLVQTEASRKLKRGTKHSIQKLREFLQKRSHKRTESPANLLQIAGQPES